MNKKEQILKLVKEIIDEENNKKFKPGKDWISYSGPNFDSSEYVAAINQLLDGWLIFGKNAREFELKFPELLGKKYGTLVNSGSSANFLMVEAAKKIYNIKEREKIITPIVCFPTTLNPIIQHGLIPVFVDVELPSLNLDLDKVEKELIKDPCIKGIMFAHVLGNPPDMDRLMNLIEKYNLVFLEDSCDALGSTYKGKKLGSFGHISTCSFFPAHHMTMGEGGFVATNDALTNRIVASLRDWGRACYCNSEKPGNVTSSTACKNRFKKWLPGAPEVVYDHRYVFGEVGYNMKPLDLQGAIGLEQIKKLSEMDTARRNNFDKMRKVFSKFEKYFVLPEATENSDPCWFAFLLTIRDDAPFTREALINYFERAKIQTRPYFSGNILDHPGYFHLKPIYQNKKEFHIADIVTKNSFFLGTYIGITDEKIEYIDSVLTNFFNNREQ